MNDQSDWQPELDEDALKALIRTVIENSGEIAPNDLPSTIRERIKGRLAGDLDLDTVIADMLRSAKRQ